MSDEQSPMSDADQLRAENVRLLRKLELANKYRQHSIEVRRELERRLISWREAAEEALSECAALTAKAEAVRALPPEPRCDHEGDCSDWSHGWEFGRNATLREVGRILDDLPPLRDYSGMPHTPAQEAQERSGETETGSGRGTGVREPHGRPQGSLPVEEGP